MEKFLIVGAGFTGSVIANILANSGEHVLVIDRRNHIAGNAYDYYNKKTGITVQKYGPHIFHTNNKEVWDFLSDFTDWNHFFFKPKVVIEGKTVTLPFNLTALYECFSKQFAEKLEAKLISKYGYGKKVPILDLLETEDDDLKFIAKYIYDNVFVNYTTKQWGLPPEKIDRSITERVPIYISFDNRYFQDKYQGIPSLGYSKLVQNMLNHKNISLKLNTDYYSLKGNFKAVIYTGSIDEFFNYKYGTLDYRSLKFDIKTINKEFYQESAMVNYPNNYDFTRITEHKYFYDNNSKKTIISIEYPQKFEKDKNERYYPVNNPENNQLYEKYQKDAGNLQNIHFIGRLGDYKYYNMDEAILRAMNFAQTLIKA